MKLNRLTEWLTAATGPMTALGLLAGLVPGGIMYLQTPLIKSGIFNEFWAMATAAILAGSAAMLLLWGARSVLNRKSHVLRQERFDLRVRSRSDLFGRETDAEDLSMLVQNFSLVFIDGESGSGKSSLVAHGLIPLVREKTRFIPILVAEYSGDWESGLNRRVYETMWSALSEAERTRLRIADHAAPGNIDAELIARLLKDSAFLLGQRTLLIFDQFDDYQLAHRSKFLDERQTWLQPAALKTANAFWQAVDAARLADHAALVFVIRSDAASGLHSVCFAESYAARQVLRLKATWLPRLLDQVDNDDGKGPVIAHPDDGWTDLKRIVELDLNKKGTILPQQVRIALLGLRDLTPLTPAQYRRVGRTAGVEALYIQGAMESAAGASGADVSTIRAVLLELIERGPENTVKTVQRSDAHLSRLFASETAKTRALERLRLDEIVRLVQHEGDAARWQLDHDYLAIAIAAEERASTPYAIVLRDGADAWQRAGSGWYESYRALLPMRTQLMLTWATVAPRLPFTTRSAFSYRPYQRYAAISLGRFAPLLFVLFGASGWALWTGSDSYQIQRMIESAQQVKTTSGNSSISEWADALALSGRAEDALFLARNAQSAQLKAQILAMIGGRMAEAGMPTKAVTMLKQSLSLTNSAAYATVASYSDLLVATEKLAQAGATGDALQMLNAIRADHAQSHPSAADRVPIVIQIATLYGKLSHKKEALALLQALLPLSGYHINYSVDLAVALQQFDDNANATKMILARVKYMEQQASSPEMQLRSQVAITDIYRRLSKPVERAAHLKRAVEIARTLSKPNAAATSNERAYIPSDEYASNNRFFITLVRDGHSESVAYIALLNDRITTCISALAAATEEAFRNGKMEDADRFMRLANSQVQKATTPFLRARSLLLMAAGYKKIGYASNNITTLLDAFRSALEIQEMFVSKYGVDDAINKLHIMIDLSKEFHAAGRFEESRDILRLAENLSRKMKGDPSPVLPDLAYALAEDGQLKSARRVAEQAQNQDTKLEAFAEALRGFSGYLDPTIKQRIAEEMNQDEEDRL